VTIQTTSLMFNSLEVCGWEFGTMSATGCAWT